MTRAFDTLLPAQRKRELLRIVAESGHVTVPKLAGIFSVSADTVRRDLDQLAAEGRLTRARGGALASDENEPAEVPLAARTDQQASAKRRIAAATVDLISDGQSIIFNGGTTTLAVANELGNRDRMTVITSNLLIPSVLDSRKVREAYVIGGSVRLDAGVTVGSLELPGSSASHGHKIKADFAVIGVGGVMADSGYSMTNLFEAQMIRSMMESASQSIVVCDSSKFGHVVFAQIAPLDAADYVVTDEKPPGDVGLALESAGVEVIIAT